MKQTNTLKTLLNGGALFVAVALIGFAGLGSVPQLANAGGGGGGGGGCFIADTQVRMADGSTKNIQDVTIGDVVYGQNGSVNTVIDTFTPKLDNRSLYSINKSEAFVTGGHPFLATDGTWHSIDVAEAHKENPELTVEPLVVGDVVVTETGIIFVTDITAVETNPDTQLYNFHTDNTNTFIANSYVVHNKGGGGGGSGGTGGNGFGGSDGFGGSGKSGGGGGNFDFVPPIPPTVPSTSSSTQCIIGVSAPTITMSATDPQSYNLRYQIDRNIDGSIDQYVPASGYVPSGTSQQVVLNYTTAGSFTVRIRTESELGLLSGWSPTITTNCTVASPPVVVNFCAY